MLLSTNDGFRNKTKKKGIFILTCVPNVELVIKGKKTYIKKKKIFNEDGRSAIM